MWAQALTAPETFELVEVPSLREDDLGPGQVLMRTLAGGVCGSDLPYFRGSGSGRSADGSALRPGAPGFPLHEVAGTVLASRHPDHRVGTNVVGWASAFDGLAELVISDGDGLAVYDERLTPSTAVMLQPLACVLYAVGRLAGVEGSRVAVVGLGPIGMLFAHVLKSRGAASVVGVDPVDRTAEATVFGLDDVAVARSDRWAESLPPGGGASIVVEAVGHQPATLGHCVRAAAFGGQVLYFGIPAAGDHPLDLSAFVRRNLTLHAGRTLERRRVLAEAGVYLSRHRDLAAAYVSDVFAVDQVQTAFARALEPRAGQLKIALDMT